MEHRDALEELRRRLNAEAACYRTLLEACEAHHASLLEGRPTAAQETLAVLARRLDDCRAASEHRHALALELAAALGLEPPCSIGRLLSALPDGAVDERVHQAHAEVRELALRLRETNARNQHLLTHRLDLLKEDFAALRAALRELGSEPVSGIDGDSVLLSTRA